MVALLRYEGPARALVARIKYRNQRQAVAWLADGLAARLPVGRFDVVTWAPTTVEHRRRRGFDHGEVLARAVARRLRVPAQPLLDRRPGPAQTGRPAQDRRAHPPVFTARRPLPDGIRLLLVDDVVTTGATLRAAVSTLICRSDVRVTVAVAARTPSRSGSTLTG